MDIFRNLLEQSKQYQLMDIVTIIETPTGEEAHIGQMLTLANGKIANGTLVDVHFTEQVIQQITQRSWQKPIVIELDYGGQYRLFWDRLSTLRKALVLGAGHISQPVVEMLSLIDYAVTVIDDRLEFANAQLFPKAERVICENFSVALREIDAGVYSAIIIVTRGHRYDLECLRALLSYSVPYLGMIGSRRRVDAIIQTLTEEGVNREHLSRLRAPIGLDLGAQTPGEIALSIVAEVLASTRNGTCLPLRSKKGGLSG